ncbi:type II toxin-antitoxin system prevent-host-death family antitoxin (plasmid) [Deinococcus psychrotolerans]|uniref:Type II toxin-antitoxin system prevent-host-death family antitoxin n=1 Tax=Deinococcus psychrotolerans TaxID=2489213 RepID=A0A3G8YUU7_9DEIO|nr:type II toxin-antitoxin system prevent-host-death family antitoxin [Deinococcus psychrotolerans]AZI45371.1 type II toxin-antitoxin system prevent-host-death family antitoxin [Deinococcus psychrotolerans]
MTKIWSLEDARMHFEQLIEAAHDEPQLITQGGTPLVMVQRAPIAHPAPQNALEAITGSFDWSDLPDEELFERHPSPGRTPDL